MIQLVPSLAAEVHSSETLPPPNVSPIMPLRPTFAASIARDTPALMPPYGSDPQQAFEHLKWLNAHYGDLSGWTPAMVDQVVQQNCRMQAALIDRQHRANLRRMRAAYGWAWSGQPKIHWSKEQAPPLERVVLPVGARSKTHAMHRGQCIVVSTGAEGAFPRLRSALMTSKLAGDPVFIDHQIVYAFAKSIDGRLCQLRFPGEVLWLEGQCVKRHGQVERILADDVVSVHGGVIVPLLVKISPAKTHAVVGLDTFTSAQLQTEPEPALTSLMDHPMPPADVVDIADGKPMSDLPELLRYTLGPLDAARHMSEAACIDRRSSSHMATIALRLFAKDAQFS